jgi:hypothetical protein
MPGTGALDELKSNGPETDARLTKAEAIVFLGKQTCGECHVYEYRQGQIVPRAIIPPALVKVWFRHAIFSHRAHRALDCLECHKVAQTSVVSSDVLLPTIKSCTPCHSPAGYRDGKIQGGAQFDCTECHRYHHPDTGFGGSGAAKREDISRTIDDFLSGKTAKP